MPSEIVTAQGVGPIRFGMSRAAVRRAIGAPVRAFQKAPGDPSLTDFFDSIGTFVYYDQEERCEAVELTASSEPRFRGREMLKSSFRELSQWLLTLDPALELDVVGLTSHTLGIGVYAPAAAVNPDGPAEGVIAFADGYYD